MKQIILILFIFQSVSININAQISIKGIVTNKNTNEPVSYASVYINGSSGKMTHTDNKGYFKLEGVVYPCLLVVSHLNYYPKTIDLTVNCSETMAITLSERNQQLGEVMVKAKSLREQCLKEFLEGFLGTDVWGSKAKLLNDSILFFCRTSDTTCVLNRKYANKQWQFDTAKVVNQTLTVTARGSLLVDLPLTGYTLSIDLNNFKLSRNNNITTTHTSGYFHFKPYETSNVKEISRFERNRLKAYYNSPMHFNRALFNNNLMKNGYLLYRDSFVTLNTAMHYNSNKAVITEKKDIEYQMFYFAKKDGSPIDLTDEKKYNSNKINEVKTNQILTLQNADNSRFKFLTDTCLISKNGTISPMNILYKGSIALKKVGAMLPEDYEPAINRLQNEEHHKKD